MKKLLCVLLAFALNFTLMAQEDNKGGEFRTETRLINQRMSVVITGYNGTSKQIRIPDQINGLPVVAIGDNVFRSRSVESVTFPSTLVSIGDYAFYDNNLTVIFLPQTVINIGVGAFDGNSLGGNSSPNQNGNSSPNQNGNSSSNQKGTTYERTFTIEPAHSETYYRPKSNPPATENVNIIVVPGYNPLPTSSTRTSNTVTVQQSFGPSVDTKTSTVRTGPATNQSVATDQAVRAAPPPVQSNQTPQPSSYVQTQQIYGYVQQTPSPSKSANRLNVIPENTIDLTTGQGKALTGEETSKMEGIIQKDEPLRLRMTETYPIWRNPPR
jgi:hypothetical protein